MHFGSLLHIGWKTPTMPLPYLFALATLFWLVPGNAGAQSSEFTVHSNGYIYPATTMGQLRHIVDSLDLRYRTCSADPRYTSNAQAMASAYAVDDRTLAHLEERLGGDWTSFRIATLPDSTKLIRRGLLLDRHGAAGRRFSLVPLNYGYRMTLNLAAEEVRRLSPTLYFDGRAGRLWVLDHEPRSRPLPARYAKMVEYVGCMVDTTQALFLPAAETATGDYLDDRKIEKKNRKFLRYLSRYPAKEPVDPYDSDETYADSVYTNYLRAMLSYEEGQMKWLEDRINDDPDARRFLDDLVAHVAGGHTVGERLESFLETCGRYEAALRSKRLRRVYGSCSMDASPRYHAMDIARLSAAAVEWPVFLRAHLNIMNDRFNRATDGSYARAGRGTYVGELEALGLRTTELLVGSCLDAQGLPEGHYRGDWSRVGRALTEAKDQEGVLRLLGDLVTDESLDDYNRLTGVYLLRFMARNYGSKEPNAAAQTALRKAIRDAGGEWVSLIELE